MAAVGTAYRNGIKRAGTMVSVGAALSLASCAVGPNYKPPALARIGVPDQFATATAAGQDVPSEQELATWWAALGDPLLDRLVTAAMAANPDIDAAGARLRQARASYKGARASLFPSLTGDGSAGHTALLGNGSNAIFSTPGGGTTSFATQGKIGRAHV